MPILETLRLGVAVADQDRARADTKIRQRFVAPQPQQINTVLAAAGTRGTDQCLHIDPLGGSDGVAAVSTSPASLQNAADDTETTDIMPITLGITERLRARMLEAQASQEHLNNSMPYCIAAGTRLQAASRLANYHVWKIRGVDYPQRKTGQIMYVDSTLTGVFSRTDSGFNGHLARALGNGYYTANLERLCFETPASMTAPVRSSGEGKDADPDGEMIVGMSFEAGEGQPITAYDVKLEQNVRWLVIDVVQPLIEIEGGFTPPELASMPMSRLRIAVPKDCTIMPEPVEERGATSQQVVMCLDGLPFVMCNSKEGRIPAGVVTDDDWITATSVQGLLYDPAGNVGQARKRSDAKSFWNGVRESAWHDRQCWNTIMEAMARGRCSVTMTLNGGWTKFDDTAVATRSRPGCPGTTGEPQHASEAVLVHKSGPPVNGAEPDTQPSRSKQQHRRQNTAPLDLLTSPDIIPDYNENHPRVDTPEPPA